MADLTNIDDITRLLGETIKTFGKLDVLVNNAGIYHYNHIEDKNITEEWDQIFSVDLRAVVQLIHMSVPYLEETNGTLIQISSIEAMKPVSCLNTQSNKHLIIFYIYILLTDESTIGI